MARLLFLFLPVLIIACSTPERVSSRMFYNVDSLINNQIEVLIKAGYKLEKHARIGDSIASVVITPDSTGWSNELSVFRQLEIAGRPTNRDQYEMTETDDTKSNLTVRSYVAAESPVPYVRFYYLGDFNDLRKIEAGYYETNMLYTSKRDLKLELEENNGIATLRRYRIEGYQKIMTADSVHFLVDAEVVF
jgi:hypothetical protein